MIDDESPKYKKKKPSNTSKAQIKSKHKHEYTSECILCEPEGRSHLLAFNPNTDPNLYAKATYCIICGKISDIHFFESIPLEEYNNHISRYASINELVSTKYKDLPVFVVKDILRTKIIDVH